MGEKFFAHMRQFLIQKRIAMQEIQLSNLQGNILAVIDAIVNSCQSVVISDQGKPLVKIIPCAFEKDSWIGSMRNSGKITGDIVSPAENIENWNALSE
jgi:antitoxin (DNA-binding transcriptional repressor) of toxin-antitoxin stability system